MPPALLFSLLLVADAGTFDRAPKEAWEVRNSYDLSDQAGRVVVNVTSRSYSLGAAASGDSTFRAQTEVTFGRSDGTIFIWRETLEPLSGDARGRMTVTLESLADHCKIELDTGPATQSGTYDRIRLQVPGAALVFAEVDAGLVERQLKSADLEAFREKVPPGLREMCTFLVELSDVIPAPGGILRDWVTRIAAPAGTKEDPSRARKWSRENEQSQTSKHVVPVLATPPPDSIRGPGDEIKKTKVSREERRPSGAAAPAATPAP